MPAQILPLRGEAAFLVMLPAAEARPCAGCQSCRAFFIVRYTTAPGSIVPQLSERCVGCDPAAVAAE